jgi:hypothetical protein
MPTCVFCELPAEKIEVEHEKWYGPATRFKCSGNCTEYTISGNIPLRMLRGNGAILARAAAQWEGVHGVYLELGDEEAVANAIVWYQTNFEQGIVLPLRAEEAKRVVVTVGQGRGSCEERTYRSLLGQLGKDPTVWAECFFVDPIADIAVLGPPDDQVLFDEFKAYDAMVGGAVPLSVAEAPEQGRGWLSSLDGGWFPCDVERYPALHGSLWISRSVENIVGGMSGSPILTDDGSAIGVVCAVASSIGDIEACSEGGPNAMLTRDLPGWLLQEIGVWKGLRGASLSKTAARLD